MHAHTVTHISIAVSLTKAIAISTGTMNLWRRTPHFCRTRTLQRWSHEVLSWECHGCYTSSFSGGKSSLNGGSSIARLGCCYVRWFFCWLLHLLLSLFPATSLAKKIRIVKGAFLGPRHHDHWLPSPPWVPRPFRLECQAFRNFRLFVWPFGSKCFKDTTGKQCVTSPLTIYHKNWFAQIDLLSFRYIHVHFVPVHACSMISFRSVLDLARSV